MSGIAKREEGTREEGIVMPHKGGRAGLMIFAVLAVAAIIVVAAIATGMLSFGGEKGTVTLSGAGATFPMPLILKWADEYYNETDERVQVNYGGGGSGAGITQIKDKHVDFAGSDAPLSATESSTFGLVHIPETLGAVVVAYNEPSIADLKLDGPTIARIFMKNITVWNDPAIGALNPGVTLPTDSITTVVRSDSSGTTFVFSGYLAKVSTEFDTLYGQGKSVIWPDAIGASGNPGVTQTVKTTAHSIGYIELAYAIENDVPFAQVKNHDGNFVVASLESTSAAAAGVTLPAGDGDWSQVNILDSPGANAYPIASFTYILIYKELYNEESEMNKTAAEELVSFLWWAVHDGQEYADELHYAPLPASVVEINEATLESITYEGATVR
ncbi:MAG: phosphate ABC transporter substrate-binding protein PstS [Thermoplasmata archaeon]|jgi:phosphate ABC transporter phosphate-binding protein|nr:phosphate ABC transporter substrate-binding protein PstS [Thermoplasmata archaeon]